jgi:hypothetical protein
MNFEKQLDTRTLQYNDDETCHTFLNKQLLCYKDEKNVFLGLSIIPKKEVQFWVKGFNRSRFTFEHTKR